MFSKLSFRALRAWSPRLWILGAALWMAAGPLSAQQVPLSSPAPEVAARAAVLMNSATGEILFAKEPHLRLPPASTTKVLTALVVLDRLDPNMRLPVSAQAASVAPSRVGLRAGEAVMTQDLLYGLLLKSGNDAAETLAEAAGGSIFGFAGLMNAKAWRIGARDSHFMNPHGLPNDEHYSTVYDLALIFRQAMNHPLFADIVRTRDAALRIETGPGLYSNWRMVPVQNHNRLLVSYEGARGGKTGFTFKARHCFVGEVDRGGIPLIVAIFNSPSRSSLWQDARNLLDFGFARYGLAPPPAWVEPEPVMVRRMPVITPTAARAVAIRPARAGERRRVAARGGMATSFKATAVRVQAAKTKPVAKATVTKPVSGKVARGNPGKKPASAVAAKPVKPGTKVATVPAESNSKPQKNGKQRI
ncbi:MAG: D-alanyl-D-alanine carboxypeptidase [Candidatus Competibacter sp.]|nr:D-alanyl-D-alanine carboxypeptidase [Candidatus Competibacter sp.]MDG4585313.1 D-alanyl-D-alanine carboxypeptidase [Candidatus Competibacter sp.]